MTAAIATTPNLPVDQDPIFFLTAFDQHATDSEQRIFVKLYEEERKVRNGHTTRKGQVFTAVFPTTANLAKWCGVTTRTVNRFIKKWNGVFFEYTSGKSKRTSNIYRLFDGAYKMLDLLRLMGAYKNWEGNRRWVIHKIVTHEDYVQERRRLSTPMSQSVNRECRTTKTPSPKELSYEERDKNKRMRERPLIFVNKEESKKMQWLLEADLSEHESRKISRMFGEMEIYGATKHLWMWEKREKINCRAAFIMASAKSHALKNLQRVV